MKLKKNTFYLLLIFFASFLAHYIGRDFKFDLQYKWIYTGTTYLGYALLFLSVFASVTNTIEILKSNDIKPKTGWILLSLIPVLFCIVVFILSLTVFDLKFF